MESRLTFGEYMRRLRRARKWSLSTLSEQCELSYAHLSRLENDSVVPTVDSVVKLAEALDGDLKAMLEMANCLPRTILDRISAQEELGTSLLRTAGPYGAGAEKPTPAQDHPILPQLKEVYGLDDAQAGQLALAVDRLVRLEKSQRTSLFNLIDSISGEGGSE